MPMLLDQLLYQAVDFLRATTNFCPYSRTLQVLTAPLGNQIYELLELRPFHNPPFAGQLCVFHC
jgi:hypothetical protein